MFAMGGVALSVAMAWLYANTNGSLLLVMLMHSAVNHTMGIVPARMADPGSPLALNTSLTAWLTAAFLWLTAGYFLVRMRHAAGAVEDVRSDGRVGARALPSRKVRIRTRISVPAGPGAGNLFRPRARSVAGSPNEAGHYRHCCLGRVSPWPGFRSSPDSSR